MAIIIIAKLSRDLRITVYDEIILIEKLIYVPQSLKREIFEKYYNARIIGY
jgi:hypothetical protein